jgi:hypothetical protein
MIRNARLVRSDKAMRDISKADQSKPDRAGGVD